MLDAAMPALGGNPTFAAPGANDCYADNLSVKFFSYIEREVTAESAQGTAVSVWAGDLLDTQSLLCSSGNLEGQG